VNCEPVGLGHPLIMVRRGALASPAAVPAVTPVHHRRASTPASSERERRLHAAGGRDVRFHASGAHRRENASELLVGG
jgi:hypothetical protein